MDSKSALTPLLVYATGRSKAVVQVLLLLCVGFTSGRFILQSCLALCSQAVFFFFFFFFFFFVVVFFVFVFLFVGLFVCLFCCFFYVFVLFCLFF